MKLSEFKTATERILQMFDANQSADLVHDALGNMNELMTPCRRFVEPEAVDRDEREEALGVVERAHLIAGVDFHFPDLGYDDLRDWFRDLLGAAETLAQPVPRASRWVVLPFTSGSGKILFRCGVCGRLSNTPDISCPDKWGCETYDGQPGMMNPAPEGFK
jgi:hypothetical protein